MVRALKGLEKRWDSLCEKATEVTRGWAESCRQSGQASRCTDTTERNSKVGMSRWGSS